MAFVSAGMQGEASFAATTGAGGAGSGATAAPPSTSLVRTSSATFILSFFLFGIEEVGIQIEEPFSILPLEAFCNGAISATNAEMLAAENSGVFEKSNPTQSF